MFTSLCKLIQRCADCPLPEDLKKKEMKNGDWPLSAGRKRAQVSAALPTPHPRGFPSQGPTNGAPRTAPGLRAQRSGGSVAAAERCAVPPPGPKQPRDSRSRLRAAAARCGIAVAGTAAPSGAAGAVRGRCRPPCGVSASPDPFGVRYSPCTGEGQPLPAAHLFSGRAGGGAGRNG